MSNLVTFSDPPRARGGRSELAKILGEVRQRPGQWAYIGSSPTRAAANKRAFTIRQKAGFEATMRGCDVWARYIGDVGQEAAS